MKSIADTQDERQKKSVVARKSEEDGCGIRFFNYVINVLFNSKNLNFRFNIKQIF